MVKFGGSSFFKCSVPLAFNGRYFILEPGKPPLFSVILEYKGNPLFEITKNEPSENPITEITKSAAGIITVSEKTTGRFLYKFRPESETSIVFGKIDGDDFSVKINDKQIIANTNIFERSMISGHQVGLAIKLDGSIIMGSQFPPELLE